MLIAIVSDSHDNNVRMEKAIREMEKRDIKLLFHCGDIGVETIRFLRQQQIQVYAVCGNNDYFTELERECIGSNIGIFEDIGEIEIDKKKIAITHIPGVAEYLAGFKKYNIIFCGHTHKKEFYTVNDIRIVNPGSIIGDRFAPTFVIYDTLKDKIEFINI